MIVGARADEEGTRSKERYFSPRDKNNEWDVGDQPPELWNQFKTDFAPGTHVRIHPLLDWTELNIWEYIKRENIPTVSCTSTRATGMRYRPRLRALPHADGDQGQERRRHRRRAEERRVRNVAERAGRLQDGSTAWRAAPRWVHVMGPHAPARSGPRIARSRRRWKGAALDNAGRDAA